MVDRSVSVRVRAEAGQYVSEMGRAADATKKVGDTAAATEKQTNQAQQRQQTQARTFAQSLAQSARENEQAWSTVGSTLTGVGVGITALGAAVLKTGISYNQLQQSSRAALTTLLGDAEAANAQMDKLDEFARTSPFSKQVFIEAQQQLIGFGTAAEDVIPILDAVQNAVAATGGSNQDIAELVDIIAEVGATGKMTAENLNEFGQRGVDAASIIGEQMGKTGQQIREEITAGTLDADEAIAALTAGMQERFDGAAAGVKDTFTGALDRVSAAWRDLSSAITEPLVGTEGGGLFVGLLNNIADLMRAIEGLPTPVLQVGAALTGLSGAIALVGGGAMLAIPKIAEFITALETLGVTAATVKTALGGLGTVVAMSAALIAVDALVGSLAEAAAGASTANVSIEQLTNDLREMGSATADVGPALSELFSESFGPLRNEVETTQEVLDEFAGNAARAIGQGFWDRIGRMGPGSGEDFWMKKLQEQTEQLDAAFAEMVSNGNADEAAEQMQRFLEAAEEQGVNVEQLKDFFPEYNAALEESSAAAGTAASGQEDMAGAADTATAAIEAQQAAVETLIGSLSELAGEALGQRAAMRGFEEAMDAATASVEENGSSFNISTEAGRANQEALDNVASSAWDVVTAMQQNGATVEEMQGKMSALRDGFIETAENMGLSAEQAGKLADQFGLIPEDINVDLAINGTAAEDFAGVELEGIEVDVNANTEAAANDIEDLEENIENLDPADVQVGANTELGATMVNGFLVSIDESTGTVSINGNPQPANATLNQLLGQIGVSSEDVTINGNPIPANMTLEQLLNLINNSEEDVTIGGSNQQGKNALSSLLGLIGVSEEDVTIGGNNAPGQGSLNSLTGQINSSSGSVDVDANTAGAESAINNTARDRQSTIWVTERVSKVYSGPVSKGNADGGPVEGWAAGGPVRGPGTGRSDSVRADGPLGPSRYRLSNGEHIWTDREVRAVGGHGNIMALRNMARTGELRSVLGFADGGPMSPYGIAATPAPPITVNPQVTTTATLASEDRALLASVAASTRRLEVNGRVFAEIVDETNRRFGGKGTL